MTWTDRLWEILDNALYLLHLAAVLLVVAAAVACPLLLWQIRGELSIIRDCAQKDVTVIEVRPDGPGPVLPRVLPRLRRIGEEAGE